MLLVDCQEPLVVRIASKEATTTRGMGGGGEAEIATYVIPYFLTKVSKITRAFLFILLLRACSRVTGNRSSQNGLNLVLLCYHYSGNLGKRVVLYLFAIMINC